MAISYDTKGTATTGGGASSLTFSFTNSGDLLWVYSVNHHTLGTVTGATYNGSAMTLDQNNNASANHGQKLFHLSSPSTGAHNIVISKTDSSGWIDAIAVSYSGTDTASQPDASQTNAEATGTSYSKSITTVATDCWIVFPMCAMSGFSLTAGANTTIVQDAGWGGAHGTAFAAAHSDQGSPGSKTLTVTSTSQTFCSFLASFDPAAGAAPTFTPKVIIF